MRLQCGILVIESRQCEAPQVADDEQRVFVDRVGVKQVVLHATDDAAERRDVEAEHAVQVHAAQFVGDAFRRAQDGRNRRWLRGFCRNSSSIRCRLRLIRPIV